jgi:transcriptional regulator with XRE-family HTH domain
MRPATVDTEGRRLLLAVPGSLAELAAQVGCSRQTVANWRRGLKLPEPHHRAKIFAAWAIQPEAWALEPASADTAQATPKASAANGHGNGSAHIAGPQASTLEGCLTLLESIREERRREGLHPAERVRLAGTEAQILALRARLEERASLLEHRIVLEHPTWHRLKLLLVRVLVRHPAAAQEVAEALADVEGAPTASPKSQ